MSAKADQSAFEQCCDEVHSALDEKIDKSASGEFQPSGQYVYESSYSSFSSEVTNNISSISSTVSGLTGQYIEQSASSMFQPSGHYASASDLSAYVPFSGLEGEGGRVTGISGSAFKGHEYTGINPVTVDNTADTISVEHRTLCVDSTMTAYTTGDSAVIGVNVAGLDLSSKMDASASSLFYSTSNPSGFVTGVDLTPYQLTADMSAYAHESSLSAKLDASASSDFYSTANPSGFIDGSSASAIASAYQIVSATATQLNAGTAYLTSVNAAPISASRAGNAANASLANSAWYDGTGRIISSLPDEATVSGIASAYAESAASSKMDESGMSAYVPFSAISADENSAITSINGSSIGGGGGASIPFTGYYYDSATSATSVITADVTAVSSLAYTKYNGNVVNAYKGITDSQGIHHLGVASFIDAGAEINRDGYTLAFAPPTSMWKTSDVATGIYAPLQYGTGAGMFLNNGSYKGYLKGNEMFVCNTSIGQAARVEVHQSRGAHLCLTADKYGIVSGNFSPSGVVLSNGASHFTANLDANTNRGAALRLFGGTGSASNSQTSMAWLTPASLQVSNTASGTAKYAINSIALYDTDTSAQKTISSTSIDYWNGKLDASAIECDTASAITAIGGSAIAGGGGGGGVDSATVSAIASSYAESAASSKLDTTAQVVTSIDEAYPATGGTFISQINGTNIFAVTAHSAGDWIGASSKVDQSAYDDLYSAFTALSGVISQYSAYFSSISAKVDNSAIGVIE